MMVPVYLAPKWQPAATNYSVPWRTFRLCAQKVLLSLCLLGFGEPNQAAETRDISEASFAKIQLGMTLREVQSYSGQTQRTDDDQHVPARCRYPAARDF